MNRGFEILSEYEGRGIILPTRKTAFSAGYDLTAAEDIFVTEKKISLVPTGLKAFMLPDEVLLIYIRSSLAVKHNLILANGVSPSAQAMLGIGYKEVVEHLQGSLTLDETISKVAKNTRNFAKRQLTWYRRMNYIRWITAEI